MSPLESQKENKTGNRCLGGVIIETQYKTPKLNSFTSWGLCIDKRNEDKILELLLLLKFMDEQESKSEMEKEVKPDHRSKKLTCV